MANEFNITLPIESYEVIRGNAENPDGWLRLIGWASDSSVDQLNGEMTPNCVVGMVECVNTRTYKNLNDLRASAVEPVIVDVEHSNHYTDEIGYVSKARAVYDLTPEMEKAGIKAPVMEVEMMIDLGMSAGKDLRRRLDQGKQFGLSIFGKVLDSKRVVNRSTNQVIERFEKVDLHKIAITTRPVNKNTWMAEIKRSLDESDMPTVETEDVVGTPVADSSVSLEDQIEHAVAEETEQAVEGPAVETPAPDESPAVEVARAEPEEGLSADALADIAGLGAPVPAQVPSEGLDPGALADIAGLGAIAVPSHTVARAEETPAPVVAEATQEDVSGQLSEGISDAVAGWMLFRSQTENAVNEVRSLLAPLPEFIRLTNERMEGLERSLAERDETIARLNERLDAYGRQGQGRRGTTLLRSFAELEREEQESRPRPLGSELSAQDRAAVARSLTESGNQTAAVAFLMGMLPEMQSEAKNTRPSDPLLPEKP